MNNELKTNDNTNKKLITAMKWIECMQLDHSPINYLKKNGVNEIVVYGITELSKLLINEALKKEYKIIAITDKKVVKGGYYYENIPVISIQDLSKEPYSSSYIVITSVNFEEEIENELDKQGIKNVVSLRELLEC